MRSSPADSKPPSASFERLLRRWLTQPIHALRELFRSRPARGRAALWIVALALAVGALRPGAVSLVRLASALRSGSGGTAAARARILGAAYTSKVEAIRKVLPRNASYGLVEAGEEEGGILWLRYDLAPRKAIDLGRLETLAAHPRRTEQLSSEVRWIVVSHGYRSAPELLDRRQLDALLEGVRHDG